MATIEQPQEDVAKGKVRRNLHLWVAGIVAAGLIATIFFGAGEMHEPKPQKESPPEPPPSQTDRIAEIIKEQRNEAVAPKPEGKPVAPQELIDEMNRAGGAGSARAGSGRQDAERERREAEILASPISLNIAQQASGGQQAVPATPSPIESLLLKQAEAAVQASREQSKLQAEALRAAQTMGAEPKSAVRRDQDWLREQETTTQDEQPIRPKRHAWPHIIQAGTVIPAVLLTRINSDLPGMVTAQVVSDVYDSRTSTTLLIPKGSKLVGRYNNEVRIGQERVLIAFQRIYLPDGRFLDLGAMQGADASGQSGLEDKVDNHFFRIFGASFLIAGISRIFGDSTNVTVNNFGGSSTIVTDVAGTALSEAARAALERNRNIPPTLIIEEGFRFNVMVNRDLALEPYRAH
ncbi:TrbI/VirB10 family protein [Pelomicrobium methylotrophicum]|uniref:Conjugal transfer protein TrbI n=1 Tax=Pelomicrobium methylotrophicum TaxID=2602750 RepID=A0A5C7EJH6_9PROT|nr:TrbI/VirB10 family protein [Pelomicrobium methylotrophicum]TXF11593.1 hypothetical protein FR698_09645 [Pelomicrobium methylotrophicum]